MPTTSLQQPQGIRYERPAPETLIAPGDLLWRDSEGYARPASDLNEVNDTWMGVLASQARCAETFLGRAVDYSPAGSSIPIAVEEDVIVTYPLDEPTTLSQGDLVGVASATGSSLADQVLTYVTTPLVCIGEVLNGGEALEKATVRLRAAAPWQVGSHAGTATLRLESVENTTALVCHVPTGFHFRLLAVCASVGVAPASGESATIGVSSQGASPTDLLTDPITISSTTPPFTLLSGSLDPSTCIVPGGAAAIEIQVAYTAGGSPEPMEGLLVTVIYQLVPDKV